MRYKNNKFLTNHLTAFWVEICYFYISQTKLSLDKIFYKIVCHHIICMCDFLGKFRRLFYRGLHEFSQQAGFHSIRCLSSQYLTHNSVDRRQGWPNNGLVQFGTAFSSRRSCKARPVLFNATFFFHPENSPRFIHSRYLNMTCLLLCHNDTAAVTSSMSPKQTAG